MRRALVITLALLLACLTTVTWAGWATAAHGLAGARSAVVPMAATPTASVGAGGVAVAWAAVDGATGYAVERTQQETGTTQPACGGAVATTGCTDAAVPAGTWTYRVRALVASWRGPASLASTPVLVEGVASATLDVTPRTAVPGDDLTITGTGWPEATTVAIEVGGTTLCTATGDFTTTCALPDRAAGSYAVRAKAGTTVVTSGTLQVVPGLRAVTPITSPGGQLSLRGRGFAGSSRVDVLLGDRALHQATTTQFGETNTLQLVVPADVAPGAYTLRATDAAGNEASAPVTVAAAGLQVTPASATPGDTVRVDGVGWPAGSTVNVRVRSTPLCALTADAFGAVSGGCTLPDTAGGDTEIRATNGASTAASPFRVLASVAPTSAAATSPGGSLQLKARGFGASSAIRVQFDDGPITPIPYTTPESGTLTFDVKVPQLASGQHTVRVSDLAGSSATTTVRVVAPELTLSESSGPAQGTISVSGQNWPASAGVSVRFDGNTYNCSYVTRTDGSFGPSPCTIPVLAGGPHTVTATSVTAVLGAPLAFTITPKVTASPTSASPGQQVTLNATGLPASSSVTFSVGGQQVATVTTSSTGTANLAAPVPDVPAGPTAVRVVGALGASPDVTIAVYRPTVQLSTATIVPNQPVRVTGSGWPVGQQVLVRIGSSTLCAVLATGGNLDQSCTPQSSPGGAGQAVVAVGQQLGSVTATAPGTVTVVAVGTLDVASAAPGRTVYALARGLLAGRTAEFYVGGVLVESRTVPSDGTWQRAYTVPAGTPPGPLELEFRQQDAPPVRLMLTVLP